MEHPNTISGLRAKRADLVKLHDQLVADAKKVICDIDHIDATIRIFDPEADIARRLRNRYAIKHRAHFGQTRRLVLDVLRKAALPMTSVALTRAWIEHRGLQPDESTRVILTKRIGACLTSLKRQGVIEHAGMDGEYKTWRIKADAPSAQRRSSQGA